MPQARATDIAVAAFRDDLLVVWGYSDDSTTVRYAYCDLYGEIWNGADESGEW